MKYFSKISILFLIGICPVFCQGQSSKFQLGIEGGPSLSTIRYDLFFFPSKYCEAGLGGTVGVAFKYNINDRLAIKTNLSYERKDILWNFKSYKRWDYIVFPMLLQVKIGKARRFFVNAGPYVGYLLSMTEKYSDTDINTLTDHYKRFDIGASMGIGFELPIFHQFSLTFEIRNNLGLLNISRNLTYIDKHGNPVTEIGDSYTHSTVILLGFVYDFRQEKTK